jgi:hypothetical protein
LLAPLSFLPLAYFTVRNFPEVLEGKFSLEATWAWFLLASLFIGFGIWVFSRWVRYRVGRGSIESRLVNHGRRGVVVGVTTSPLGTLERKGRDSERRWVVIFDGGQSLSLIDQSRTDVDLSELSLDVPIVSIGLAESSFSRGARAALAVSFSDGSEAHLEIEGPYGPIFYPTVNEVSQTLERANRLSRP